MDSFKFHDIRAEKANAILRYRRTERITTLLRFVEALVLLIAVARLSTQFSFSFKAPSEYLRGISVGAVMSPKFVFVVGNVIVIVLFFISGHFSSASTDFCRYKVPSGDKKIICRVRSENLDRRSANGGEDGHRRDLRRSASEMCRKSSTDRSRKTANEMSSEEFRQTVEAFIERQQRFLREEEEEEEL